jgi:hypothetical protein
MWLKKGKRKHLTWRAKNAITSAFVKAFVAKTNFVRLWGRVQRPCPNKKNATRKKEEEAKVYENNGKERNYSLLVAILFHFYL